MTWQSVCYAWVAELTANVTALADAKIHRYAPWSLEQLYGDAGEIHLAVWPTEEAEAAEGFVSLPSSLMTQSWVAVVWENVGAEAGRLIDDDAGNSAWLAIHEAIRDRFQTKANERLGGMDIMDTRYVGGAFPAHAGYRVAELRFQVRVQKMHS